MKDVKLPEATERLINLDLESRHQDQSWWETTEGGRCAPCKH